jgi:hypothetical protein
MAVKIKNVVLWVIPLCSCVVGYQCFKVTCCLYVQDRFSPTLKMGAADFLEMLVTIFENYCHNPENYNCNEVYIDSMNVEHITVFFSKLTW